MHTQRGYISIALILFGLMLAYFVYPRSYPPIIAKPCSLGKAPPPNTFHPFLPIKARDEVNASMAVNPEAVKYTQGGPDKTATPIQYRLIREAVPVDGDPLFNPQRFGEHSERYDPITIDSKEFIIYYPSLYGEFDLTYPLDNAPYNDKGKTQDGDNVYRFRQEGIIYLVAASNGEPIIQNVNSTRVNDKGVTVPSVKPIYTVDFWQEDEIYRDPNRKYDDNGRIFECGNQKDQTSVALTTSAIIPPQDVSSDKTQLNLQWFNFNTSNFVEAHCKPAIYLYPKDKTLVNVKVNTKGFLSYTDPQYDSKTGWTVTAYPDGAIESTNPQLLTKNYPYLYYESKIPTKLIEKPTEGWVVKSGELGSFFTNTLPKLGLNDVQTKDFKEYWEKSLPTAPYYFIGFISEKNLNDFEPLDITPKPDYINRVRAYFEPLQQPKQVTAPILINPSPLNPNHFSVVEWGGMVKRHDGEFTCSE